MHLSSGTVPLGGGSLIIKLGSQDIVAPGDYTLKTAKGDIRVVAHNPYSACSRKWYDFDHNPYPSARGEDHPAGGRRRLSLLAPTSSESKKEPIEFLLENRESWISSAECANWVQGRKDNEDLFRQVGDWSTISSRRHLSATTLNTARTRLATTNLVPTRLSTPMSPT